MELRRPPLNLLNFDWESVRKQLPDADPNDGNFYMIVFNRGQKDEHRTRFMSYKEVMDIVVLAVEKKKLQIPITLP